MCEGIDAYEAGWKDACDITDELLKSMMYDLEGCRQQNIRLRAQLAALDAAARGPAAGGAS